MDEIIKKPWYAVILLTLLLSSMVNISGQEEQGKKRVEVLHSDEGIFEGDLRILRYNVLMKHKDTFMSCDSAYYNEKKEVVNAYGQIHIYRGDTLHLYGRVLRYDWGREKASLTDSVILINNETTLYTNHIDYDLKNDIANYNTGGKIVNKDNVLTSRIGIYYTSSDILNFKDSVILVNPDYTMYSDTLEYNSNTETAFFHGPTRVIGDSIETKCRRGWHDTKKEQTLLLGDAMVKNMKQVITGDSIYYDAGIGYGTAFFDVTMSDQTRDVIVKGNKMWYYEEPEKYTVTDSAQFIEVSGEKFMYLHADTLRSVDIDLDTSKVTRLLRAWHGCRLYSEKLQAKCDSISYSLTDSVIRMYDNPVLWSDDNQLVADSVYLFIKNEAMERMELYNSAFVIEQVDSTRFNQIKGKNLTGYFRNNEIYLIEVRGNGENIYYAIEDEMIMGVNQSTCANMDIYIENGNIKGIYMLSSPEGTLDPPAMKADDIRRLENFNWLKGIRPKDRYDIFRK